MRRPRSAVLLALTLLLVPPLAACEEGSPARTILIHNDTTATVIVQEPRWPAKGVKLLRSKAIKAGKTLKLSQADDLIGFSTNTNAGVLKGSDGRAVSSVEELRLSVGDAHAQNWRCVAVRFILRARGKPDVPVTVQLSAATPGFCPDFFPALPLDEPSPVAVFGTPQP